MKRRGKLPAILAALAVTGCASSAPLEDMVGYVPPTSLPAQPKRTLVAEKRELVWAQLVDLLATSAFEVDLADEDKGLLVARYSGDPEPFIDCGSIVTHQNGTLGQIAGSAPTVELNYELENDPVILNRTLNLDSRIIIRVAEQSQGTVIKTDTTYVVTKIIDVVDQSGAVREGNRETVSFEAGDRGEFSKGTACQPNGSLDLAVVQSLPKIVGTDEIDRAQLPDDDIFPIGDEIQDGDVVADLQLPDDVGGKVETVVDPIDETLQSELEVDDVAERAADNLDAAAIPVPLPDATAVSSPSAGETTYDWILPDQGLPKAALPRSDRAEGDGVFQEPDQEIASLETQDERELNSEAPLTDPSEIERETAAVIPDSPVSDQSSSIDLSSTTIVDDTTKKLLQSLDCAGEEWHFCDLVELTTPFRKRNIDKLLGLTVNTTESFTSQAVGRDLRLDVLFPSFPSHLHIAYARRDGTIEHVLSSEDVWPADLAHQFTETGRTIPGPAGLAMIVAIASDRPLFASPPNAPEEATDYLNRLRQRLDDLEAEDPDGLVTASQLLIYVDSDGT